MWATLARLTKWALIGFTGLFLVLWIGANWDKHHDLGGNQVAVWSPRVAGYGDFLADLYELVGSDGDSVRRYFYQFDAARSGMGTDISHFNPNHAGWLDSFVVLFFAALPVWIVLLVLRWFFAWMSRRSGYRPSAPSASSYSGGLSVLPSRESPHSLLKLGGLVIALLIFLLVLLPMIQDVQDRRQSSDLITEIEALVSSSYLDWDPVTDVAACKSVAVVDGTLDIDDMPRYPKTDRSPEDATRIRKTCLFNGQAYFEQQAKVAIIKPLALASWVAFVQSNYDLAIHGILKPEGTDPDIPSTIEPFQEILDRANALYTDNHEGVRSGVLDLVAVVKNSSDDERQRVKDKLTAITNVLDPTIQRLWSSADIQDQAAAAQAMLLLRGQDCLPLVQRGIDISADPPSKEVAELDRQLADVLDGKSVVSLDCTKVQVEQIVQQQAETHQTTDDAAGDGVSLNLSTTTLQDNRELVAGLALVLVVGVGYGIKRHRDRPYYKR